MITIDQVIKEVAKRLDIDVDLVSVICKHPFNCTVKVMKDKNNIQDILYKNLFKFKLKRRYKENKTKEYCSK